LPFLVIIFPVHPIRILRFLSFFPPDDDHQHHHYHYHYHHRYHHHSTSSFLPSRCRSPAPPGGSQLLGVILTSTSSQARTSSLVCGGSSPLWPSSRPPSSPPSSTPRFQPPPRPLRPISCRMVTNPGLSVPVPRTSWPETCSFRP